MEKENKKWFIGVKVDFFFCGGGEREEGGEKEGRCWEEGEGKVKNLEHLEEILHLVNPDMFL